MPSYAPPPLAYCVGWFWYGLPIKLGNRIRGGRIVNAMSLGLPPPFVHLGDDTLRASLQCLRAACAPILANNLLPHFTDHSVEHADHVARIVDDFIRPLQLGESALNDPELVALYAACYLHDIGMQFENAGGVLSSLGVSLKLPWNELQEAARRDLLREHHNRISAEMVMASARPGQPLVGIMLTPEYQPGYVARLCEAHILDVKDARYQELTQGGPGMRMALLSGVLRMADILDESRRRASRLRAQTLALDPVAQMHWWRHYYVENITFDLAERAIMLWFDFPPQRWEEYRRIVPRLQLPAITAELTRHQVPFNRAGLSWTARVNDAPQPYSTSDSMPESVLVSMVKEIGTQQKFEEQERIRRNLDILEEGRPLILRQLDGLESRRETLEPAQYLRERFELADELWNLGGHRSARMMVGGDYNRDGAALPTEDRLRYGIRLARMMQDDGSSDHGAQVLHALETLASATDLPRDLRFTFWELNARCLVGVGGMEQAIVAINNAIMLAPDPAAKAKLVALRAEFYFVQAEIAQALQAATEP